MVIQWLDQARRWLNLLLSIGQIAVTVLCFALGTSFYDAAGPPSADPPIVPAGYAFIVWSVIYGGCLAYGIYQFGPSRIQDALMRRIGFATASGFLGCCVWLLCVRFGHLPWTVPCILWMAASILWAFATLTEGRDQSWKFRLCVVAPMSIYAAWLSVAIFANTASIAKAFAWRPELLGESTGSILLMLIAAGLATFMLWRSNGNLWYAGTILWALAAIGVRNQFELRNGNVALTAWLLLATFAVLAFAHPFSARLKSPGR